MTTFKNFNARIKAVIDKLKYDCFILTTLCHIYSTRKYANFPQSTFIKVS